MSRRCLALTGVLAFVVATSLAPASVAGQTASKASTAAQAPTWKTPRTADGQPDLQGVWDYRTVTPLERPRAVGDKAVLTDEEAVKFEEEVNRAQNRDLIDSKKGGAGVYVPESEGGVVPYNEFWYDRGNKILADKRTSLIIDPPDGRLPPRTPEGQKRAAASAKEDRLNQMGHPHADSYLGRSVGERCIARPDNLPIRPGAYNNNVQLIQGPGYVAILNEMIHTHRIVPLDGRPHADQSIDQWLGDSRGRWEGETLVVETTNLRSGDDGAGARMHVTERFTRTSPATLVYRFTVDDPETWTKPWTGELSMTKSSEHIYEYACHEGNDGIVGILAGARADEKKAGSVTEKRDESR